MSIEQNMCEEKIFKLQSMSHPVTCIDERIETVKNSGISCLTSILDLSNPK